MRRTIIAPSMAGLFAGAGGVAHAERPDPNSDDHAIHVVREYMPHRAPAGGLSGWGTAYGSRREAAADPRL